MRARAEAFVAKQAKDHNPKSGAAGTPKARRKKWHEESVQRFMDKFYKDQNDKGGAGGGIAAT